MLGLALWGSYGQYNTSGGSLNGPLFNAPETQNILSRSFDIFKHVIPGEMWQTLLVPLILFTCAAQRCDVLDPPQNGRVNINSFTIGSTATYSCFPGFTLVGQDTRTCQANGVWTGSAPFCQAVTCDVLTAQENGRVTLTGTQVGDTATYSCLPGFDLQGTQLRTCGPNGEWSLQEPVCVGEWPVNLYTLTSNFNNIIVLFCLKV